MATLNEALASRYEPVSIQLHMQEAFTTKDKNALLAHIKKSLSHGHENFTFFARGGGVPGRNRDGLFSAWPYSRLSAVVVARRQERFSLFGPYNLWLFRNPGASIQADEAVVALGVEDVYGPVDFP